MDLDVIFETERLYARLLEKSDLENLVALDSDPVVRQYYPGGPLSAAKIKEKLEKIIQLWNSLGYSDFAIIEKSTRNFVGRAGFGKYKDDIEMGYIFLKEYWGRGYATEISKALLEWAKNNIKGYRIIGLVPEDHIASQRVLEKVGMVFFKNEKYEGSHDLACKNVICKFYEYRLDNS